jgi:NTP pyrophosphatase (non-canonical NTP hydrolase)
MSGWIEAEADPWPVIDRLVDWLDQNNGRSHNEITLRLLKISEEAGEVAQAWIGYTGQNPRKGTTHSAADVADELCDVIVTAMVALTCVTDYPARHFAGKLAEIARKRGAGKGTSSGDQPPAEAGEAL